MYGSGLWEFRGEVVRGSCSAKEDQVGNLSVDEKGLTSPSGHGCSPLPLGMIPSISPMMLLLRLPSDVPDEIEASTENGRCMNKDVVDEDGGDASLGEMGS